MKVNITLALEEELVRAARVLAAQRSTSVSRMLAAELEQIINHEADYQRARKEALDYLDEGCALTSGPLSRDQVHER